MIEKTVKIDVETGGSKSALKEIVDLFKQLVEEEKQVQKEADKVANDVENIGKAGTKAKKGLKAVSVGFKAIGTALKAAGIGLVISLFVTLKDVLGQNQKVVDTLSSAFGAISITINNVFKALTDTYNAVSKATGGFDALGKVLMGVLTLAVTPLKLGFYNIKLGIETAQLAWEKSVFGDGDTATIDALNKSIDATKTALVGVAAEAVVAGQDVVNNFSEAIDEVGQFTTTAIDKVSDVSVKAAFEQSKITQQLANNAKLATAQQSLLVEKYDRQAEKLRQIRDNDLLSLSEREKANNDLLQVLDNQEKAMLKQADAVLASAQAELKKNNNIENQTALIDAQANKLGVLAQIEGFRSEQDVNKNALLKEQNELILSGSEAETARALNQRQFNTSLEEDAVKRLEQQKLDLEAERSIEEQRLQLKVDSFALGTQARLDAENEKKDRLQEIDQQITTNEAEQLKARDAAKIKSDKKEIDLAKRKEQLKQDLVANTFGIINSFAEEGSILAKGVAVAQATMNTFQGITKALAETTDPTPTQSLRFANAAAVGVMGALNVAKILSTDSSGKSGSNISGAVARPEAPAQPPAFNLVGGSGVNQVQDTLTQDQAPIKAIVVSSDMTNQQEVDRAQAESASLG